MRLESFGGRQWMCPDKISIQQRLSTIWHIDTALRHVRDPQVVVQAGGNLGQWPLYLSSRFKRVYTFEPDPLNFACLVHNASAPNVFPFRAALGTHGGLVGMVADAENCEAAHVGGSAAQVPLVTIDRVVEDRVDLILLDVEGYELHALAGAVDTIEEWRPVILIEDRHQARYDHTIHDVTSFLEGFGYKEIDRANKDIVYGYSE